MTTCASPASIVRVPTRAPHCVDLMVDVNLNHVASLMSRCRLPRATSVAERVEVWCPESAERVEPLVDVAQRAAVHRVQPPLTVRPHRRETVVPQHLQVLGYRRLADRELALDGGADRARRHLAVGEQFQNAPPHRIAKDVERVHPPKLKLTYISQDFNLSVVSHLRRRGAPAEAPGRPAPACGLGWASAAAGESCAAKIGSGSAPCEQRQARRG